MYDLTMIPFTTLVLLLIIYRRNLKDYGLHNHRFLLTKPWYLSKADSESNSKFDIYAGKSKEADDTSALGKSAAVVMNLVKGLDIKVTMYIWINYYT